MWPSDPIEQVKLARDFVSGRAEHQRVDLKSTLSLDPKRAVVEMIRDISAIANTDEDWGYIVLGAQRGKVVGQVDALSDANLERTSEKLTQVSHNYLDPVPRFRLVPFHDPVVGVWGIIVVEPSTDQPYMFVRGFTDEKDKPVLRSGDWYVRRGDTTDLALPRDWARVLERRVRRALQPMEFEIGALRERVAAVESNIPSGVRRAVGLLRMIPKSKPIKVHNGSNPTIEGPLDEIREDQNAFVVRVKGGATKALPLDAIETVYGSADQTCWTVVMRVPCPPA